jgi:hypothetical protein
MSFEVENEDLDPTAVVDVNITGPDPLPVDLDLSGLQTVLDNLLAHFTGTAVPKSDDISGNGAFAIPANSKNSVTLIVNQGVVIFDTTTHGVGSYTWSAPLLKKLNSMTFDASGSTNAQILSTQVTV